MLENFQNIINSVELDTLINFVESTKIQMYWLMNLLLFLVITILENQL